MKRYNGINESKELDDNLEGISDRKRPRVIEIDQEYEPRREARIFLDLTADDSEPILCTTEPHVAAAVLPKVLSSPSSVTMKKTEGHVTVAGSGNSSSSSSSGGGGGGGGGVLDYSEQQLLIAAQARPPGESSAIIRVTAAAGTGKSTVLELLAERHRILGHDVNKIGYVAFNKTVVAEISQRFGHKAVVSTLHSLAFRMIGLDEERTNLIQDTKIDEFIENRLEDNIERFISQIPPVAKTSPCKLVRYYIKKTLELFLQSKRSEEEGLNSKNFGTVYYPAILWHKENNHPISKFSVMQFYCECAKALFNAPEFKTFDTVMKRAQLSKKNFNYSVLLVDESQDLTECQLDLICMQASLYDTQVFIVGDAVQAIYGFRGAKSKYLLEIETNYPGIEIQDFQLTESFRFDDALGAVPNILLACKENSPQTTGEKNRTWIPYRIDGRGGCSGTGDGDVGEVTTANLIEQIYSTPDQWQPVTVVAFTNFELFEFAIENISQPGEHRVLKFALNGSGSSSGRAKWIKEKSTLQSLFDVFTGEKQTFNRYPWEEVSNLSWGQIQEDVMKFELNALMPFVSLVNKYEDDAMNVFAMFEQNVLDRPIPCYQADVILSTIHAAKGMEWDRVMVLDSSLIQLNKFTIVSDACTTPTRSSFTTAGAIKTESTGIKKGQFGYSGRGTLAETINLWYVAVTRAKKILSIPPKLSQLISDIVRLNRRVHELSCMTNPVGSPSDQAQFIQEQDQDIFGEMQCYPEQVRILHRDIFVPIQSDLLLRKGLTVDGKSLI